MPQKMAEIQLETDLICGGQLLVQRMEQPLHSQS
jgi:hypothetical protein